MANAGEKNDQRNSEIALPLDVMSSHKEIKKSISDTNESNDNHTSSLSHSPELSSEEEVKYKLAFTKSRRLRIAYTLTEKQKAIGAL